MGDAGDQVADGAGKAKPGSAPTFAIARSLFVRGLGVVYAVAFASWWVQFKGLVGERGISPSRELLEVAREQLGAAEAVWQLPGVFWWTGASDAAQSLVCAAGLVAALAVVAGLLPGPGLALLWVLYLTLVSFGGVFMGYQWEALLLEAGFLGLLWAPWWVWRLRSSPRLDPPPPVLVHWLLRWLLFRLMFFSGVVKLASRDEVWWDLTALTVHYETQPLPTWTAFYAHHLPVWAHVASCAAMFFVELVLGWCVFGPRRFRAAAFVGTVGLMAAIAATGNYTYFNLLTVVLCLPLLDDRQWGWLGGKVSFGRGKGRPAAETEPAPAPVRGRWLGEAIRLPAVALVLLLSLLAAYRQTCSHLLRRVPLKLPRLTEFSQHFAPFHLVGSYGLFANMTESRPELVVEGTADGVEWKPYRFRYKPGDLSRRPRFVAPHQPRLDWQMWFEALRAEAGVPPSRWFRGFLAALAEGEPDVVALLEENPFRDAPPQALRVVMYDYRFAEPGSGVWWERERIRDYVRPVRVR